jgi:hypothetical protein
MSILQKISRDSSARWVMASLLAPVLPTLVWVAYFYLKDPTAGRVSWLVLFLAIPLYSVSGPTFIFVYSRVVSANLFLSALGGFAIPALIVWMYAGNFWSLPLKIGVYGALCGASFDFVLHGFKFNTRIRLKHGSQAIPARV